ncbi:MULTISPECIES: hypothetical protein [Nocardiaceae]|uniref:hypothetical protein n=1 Tax=Nocardiaceae TaxID=85025 RepID=UPI000A66FE22|nr:MULTISPECIES: hypothetical protein [Rhodococcus]OZC60513.1 hypothetical protein CH277_27600 [Rhodococcus sp. 06-469-3-2]OZE89235.1 hypothetical protein CH302_27975 [Rhodococcus sp. 15-2388-1-1a]OZF42330.1 hypothetical protein CH293_26795 [Rhodococcus sp. 14-2470-1b]
MTRWSVHPGPVAVPIDRWGHMPFPAQSMSPAGVGWIVDAHRTGQPPRHDPRPPRSLLLGDRALEADMTGSPPQPVAAALDSDYYRIGIDARRRAHTDLADVSDITDDLEHRIENLLQRTLELLDGAPKPEAQPHIEWVG